DRLYDAVTIHDVHTVHESDAGAAGAKLLGIVVNDVLSEHGQRLGPVELLQLVQVSHARSRPSPSGVDARRTGEGASGLPSFPSRPTRTRLTRALRGRGARTRITSSASSSTRPSAIVLPSPPAYPHNPPAPTA